MADSTQNKGFTLPAPTTAVKQPAANASQPVVLTITPSNLGIVAGPQPRAYVIAGGVLLVLLIAFFFAKGAYANYRAGKQVSPGAANASGWCLFILLRGLAAAAVLSVLDPVKFITPIFMAPLFGISLVALVLMFVTGRRS